MAPAWLPFVAATALLAVVVVALARASADLLTGEATRSEGVDLADEADLVEEEAPTDEQDPPDEDDLTDEVDPLDEADLPGDVRPDPIPTRVLLANVVATQGVAGVLVVAAAWLAGIPWTALGLGPGAVDGRAVALGVALGSGLYLASEAAARVVDEDALVYAERLRERLAPTDARGWVALLAVVLPLVAGFEELLFRAALVGVPVVGLGVPAWLAAVASSLLFGLAHGAQGRVGVVVTGVLGLALAAAFVVTGSLMVVVVAHYVVNAAEFVVHEGLATVE